MEFVRDLVNINILNTNEKHYLPRCLDACLAQTYQPRVITVIDNASTDGSAQLVAEHYPEVRLLCNERNLWYCGGHNRGIRESTGEFVLVLNVDVFLEPDFLEEMVAAIRQDPRHAAVQGKIYQFREDDPDWRGLDTVGIRITRSRRNFDRGQGEPDAGQYDGMREIFGADGVAPLYRRAALEDIRFEDEYFDEDFLIYREVVDMSWRLHRRGWRTVFAPQAVGRHVRGFSPQTRHTRSPFVKQLSYRNRLLTLVKNDTFGCWLAQAHRVLTFDLAMLGYILLREPHLLKAFGPFFRLLPRALRKRRHIQRTALVPNRQVTRWFE
jgi:GT2 family glycosyltransferase